MPLNNNKSNYHYYYYYVYGRQLGNVVSLHRQCIASSTSFCYELYCTDTNNFLLLYIQLFLSSHLPCLHRIKNKILTFIYSTSSRAPFSLISHSLSHSTLTLYNQSNSNTSLHYLPSNTITFIYLIVYYLLYLSYWPLTFTFCTQYQTQCTFHPYLVDYNTRKREGKKKGGNLWPESRKREKVRLIHIVLKICWNV